MDRLSTVRGIEMAMAQAADYVEWYRLALAHDALTGADVWRRRVDSDLVHGSRIQVHTRQLQVLHAPETGCPCCTPCRTVCTGSGASLPILNSING
jgi:hypothetical protein